MLPEVGPASLRRGAPLRVREQPRAATGAAAAASAEPVATRPRLRERRAQVFALVPSDRQSAGGTVGAGGGLGSKIGRPCALCRDAQPTTGATMRTRRQSHAAARSSTASTSTPRSSCAITRSPAPRGRWRSALCTHARLRRCTGACRPPPSPRGHAAFDKRGAQALWDLEEDIQLAEAARARPAATRSPLLARARPVARGWARAEMRRRSRRSRRRARTIEDAGRCSAVLRDAERRAAHARRERGLRREGGDHDPRDHGGGRGAPGRTRSPSSRKSRPRRTRARASRRCRTRSGLRPRSPPASPRSRCASTSRSRRASTSCS